MNIAVLILALALMALGAGELMGWAVERAFGHGRCKGRSLLLLMPEGPEECEGLIRQAEASGERFRILCVVGDPESREIALRLRESYKCLEVCAPEELPALLEM